VYRDEGAVDDPRVVAGVGEGSQRAGPHRHQVMKDAVGGGLAGVKRRGQRPPVVRLVRRLIGTSNTHAGSGNDRGRPEQPGNCCRVNR
jgi:hypothetical protein